ncbi:SslE/AcfD family lipoprotein zinc metalloprotease [Enterovibrio norvegicus]|uniref:Accessory colonization factor AcfD n=1 Tax=Enterovibrio norvegicus TaxID=188144 RepID=A0A2N7LAX1_9GAMM|nr:SslE/AcfD family lipoprotein zinc metalloprotease [Enterovibrio norvegicus]PMN92278.1 Accessory colonization factor AcfD [Enterovibrio norvegicus]
MNNKKLLYVLIAAALTGCNNDDSVVLPEPETPNPEIQEPAVPGIGPDGLPDIGVNDPIVAGEFSLDSNLIFGSSVTCNGQPANAFEFEQRESVACDVEGMTLATFSHVFDTPERQQDGEIVRHKLTLSDADEFTDNPDMATNALALVRSVAVSHEKQIDFDFTTSQAKLDFIATYSNDLDMAPEDFKELIEEAPAEENLVDKLPSTHVPDIEPEVSPGTSVDLNAGFVSADAESAYQYTPKEAILSKAAITDSLGTPVQGLAYFSKSSRGKTDENGLFEFVWGESISFGIDTFELGSVRGNQTAFELSDLGPDQRGRNAEALVKRYGNTQQSHIEVSETVERVFAQYPNVINEVISLSLSDKDTTLDIGGGQTATVAAEFAKQFTEGLAADIDAAICNGACDNASTLASSNDTRVASDDLANIQADINKLWGINGEEKNGWKPVDAFHVFADATNFYGSVGAARGQAAVNVSNRAIPIMMARNDNNYWISFGEYKAYDEGDLAYITEKPSAQIVDKVGGSTATYGLPFASLGQIGAGKIMVVGNARYNSILVCPTNYSWNNAVNSNAECVGREDSNDMKHFFSNVIRYLTNRADSEVINVGTNIPYVYFAKAGQWAGNQADYKIADAFNVTTNQLSHFDDINPKETPLLIINGFEYKFGDGSHYTLPHSANLDKPKLTQKDVNALIEYARQGGSILVMETVTDTNNAGELGRLLDAAGIAFGMGGSVVPTGNGPNDGYADRVRANREYGLWIIEHYATVANGDGVAPKLPYNIDKTTGQVTWDFLEQQKPDDKPDLLTASYEGIDDKGKPATFKAFIREEDHFYKGSDGKWELDANGQPILNEESLENAKNTLLSKFEVKGKRTYQECLRSDYHYEINCLEYRPGNSIPLTGGMSRPIYTKLGLGSEEAKAMIKAADLGTNIERLYQHETYFRTSGKEGERLSSVDLKRIYNNMSVWLWNDLDYRYESGKDDELGFERFTQFLNCYTSNSGATGTACPEDLWHSLTQLNMVYGLQDREYAGQMNPSYPLNYMEKPLTRLMLGRSFWDHKVKVDIRQFPGEPTGYHGGDSMTFDMRNQTARYFAGNRQATGQWAVAHQPFTVVSSEPVTITVGLHDDLTGRDKHELALMRPPRMQKSFKVDGSGTFTVPYGGLIYVQGGTSSAVKIDLSGTVHAPLYDKARKGWVNSIDSPAPIGEVVSDTFIYTAPKANLNASNIDGGVVQFADDLDQFSADLNDFYGRDDGLVEGSVNRAATHKDIPNNRHAFVNDVAISIGAAHSGYPVMNSGFNASSDEINTDPLNNWLIWHEVGHNAAEAPFTVEGATEVANNLVGLYMQQKHLGTMPRVERDIRIAPDFVKEENGHAWGAGGAGERLLMFAQLKEWAQTEFAIDKWYEEGKVPAYYSDEAGMEGFHLFTLMHRLTRNASDPAMSLHGDNQCRDQNLGKSDTLMLCASYAAQTDLTDFFAAWNPGVVANMLPGQSAPKYTGGITSEGEKAVAALNLPKPIRNPLAINSVTVFTAPSYF